MVWMSKYTQTGGNKSVINQKFKAHVVHGEKFHRQIRYTYCRGSLEAFKYLIGTKVKSVASMLLGENFKGLFVCLRNETCLWQTEHLPKVLAFQRCDVSN